MKKFVGLLTGLLLTVATFAQSGVSFNDASSDYDKTKTSTFNFTFDSKYSADDINTNAAYYESYFSTETTADGSKGTKVKIAVVGENEMSRKIILRLFVALDVKTINVNGVEMGRDEFIKKYVAL